MTTIETAALPTLKTRGAWTHDHCTDCWAIELRVKANPEKLVGRKINVARKDGHLSTETLGELVHYYGDGDFAVYRAA